MPGWNWQGGSWLALWDGSVGCLCLWDGSLGWLSGMAFWDGSVGWLGGGSVGREVAALTLLCEQSMDQACSCSGSALVGPTGGEGQGGAASDPTGPTHPAMPSTGGCGHPPPPELMATISKMGNYWF